MPPRKTIDPTACLKLGAANNLKKNESGEYIQWSVKSQDGDDLRVYKEYGCATGLKPAEIREKFPQFKKYTYATFNSALTSIRRSYNIQVCNRGCTNCK